jgi:uncharacterized protein
MPSQEFIYPERLSERDIVFAGALTPGELPRLGDFVASPEGALQYRVTARVDGRRRRVVSCIINGFVFLMCQRTLETFRHEIAILDRIVLVDTEEELPPIEEESEEEDFVVAASPVDVRGLVEDAVILALPMVPRKPGPQAPSGIGEGKAGKPSPFAALAGLKRPK